MTPSPLIISAERQRVEALRNLDSETQRSLGQFFTPSAAASLIVSLFQLPDSGVIRVLDPGAGSGILSAAFVDRVLAERPDLSVHLVAVECDDAVIPYLRLTLDGCVDAGRGRVTAELIHADYIELCTGVPASRTLGTFDIVVQNPPYGKLGASSPYRRSIKQLGIDAPNKYAAFVGLAVRELRDGGQLAAITPRSFFNGPYFESFRSYMLEHMTLDHIHVFESRTTIFAEGGVLQENVIFSASRNGQRDSVTISSSGDHHGDWNVHRVSYGEVVHADDPNRFIRLASDDEDTAVIEKMLALPCSLQHLEIDVSTGRVVDFRSRSALHVENPGHAYPLVYPGNFNAGAIDWPRDLRKPQYFAPLEPKDERLLLPEGWYTVVKRFSAKEERRRIVAAVWSPIKHRGPVAFENHLNIFHNDGAGLDEATARGLCAWLNSSQVDRFFRTFSGHTQVNATDLRSLRFPSLEVLRQIGEHDGSNDQSTIDAIMSEVAA